MIEQELVKRYFVGKDGFVWWLGQVTSEEKWNPNMTGKRVASSDEIKGFSDRYKVRIMGYHTDNPTELTDDDLPWASVMLPVTAGGGSGGSSQSPQIRQGNFVFGFFLDGEDAQQPIIMGILGFNNYTVVSKGVPQVKYVPFEGFKGTDTVPQGTIRETPGSSPKTSVPSSVPGAKPRAVQTATTISGSSAHQIKSVAEKVQLEEGTKKSPIMPTDICGSPMDGALLDVQEGLREIQRVKAQVNEWAGVAIGKVVDQQQRIQEITDRVIKNVTKPIKDELEKTKKFIIAQIEDKAKDIYFLLFPQARSELKVAQSETTELISCLFNKIVKGLLSIVANTLLSFINKVVNVGTCIIENVIGGLIGQIGGLVNGLVGLALGPMNAILGAFGLVIDLGSAILGFLFDALGFFKCEENPKCAGYKEWSVFDGSTVNEINKIGASFTNMLQIAENAKQSVLGSISAVGAVFGSAEAALNSFNPLGFVTSALSSCLSEILPVQCGAPTASIFGGGGNGALANPIIGTNGEIMGLDLVSRGLGYISKPFVSIQDPCGNGNGAVIRVKLNKNDNKKGSISPAKGGGYGVSVGGTTGIDYGTNVSGVDNYQRNEDPIERKSYGTVPGEWTNVGVTTNITAGFDLFDPYRVPALTLEMSPPGGIISAGDPVTIRYYTQNASRILYSNFGASTLGGFIPEENLDPNVNEDRPESRKIKVSEVTFQEIYTPKTFILTVANGYGQVTSVLRVNVVPKDNTGEINDNQIKQLIVEDPGTGYLSAPDGSSGGMGRKWADKNQTLVKKSDGTYETPYNPGDTIVVSPGDTIKTPATTSAIKRKKLKSSTLTNNPIGFINIVDEKLDQLNDELIEIPGGIDFVFDQDEEFILEENLDPNVNGETTVRDDGETTVRNEIEGIKIDIEYILSAPDPGSRQNAPDLNLNINSVFGSTLQEQNKSYPIVLELYDVEILNGGINYSSDDQFVIEPQDYGVILKPILGAFGTIVGVEVISTGRGFTTFPNILINSETGFNAKFVPIFRTIRIGDIKNIDDLGINFDNVISVVDCVGKVV